MEKTLKVVCFLVFVCSFSSGCASDYLARKILLHPSKIDRKWTPPWPDCEQVVIETPKTHTLHGVYFPCENSRGAVLYSHGNGGTVEDWGDVGQRLRETLNVSVLVYDYRGYGKSEGTPTARGVLDDGRAARKWLAEREGIAEKDIIQFGRSLGGAVAIDLASKDGAKALIVESTFASLPEMSSRFVTGFPARLFLWEQLPSDAKIAKYDSPLFLSHGTEDTLIPFEQGEKLYKNAASRKKEFYPIEGGGHNTFPPPEYYEALKQFLDSI